MYLWVNFEVSSVILRSFRQGVIPPTPATSKGTPKKSTHVRVNHNFKKVKHWNLEITSYWVIGASCSMQKDLELSPCPPNYSKDFWKLLPLLISISWSRLLTQWDVDQKIHSKMHPVSCTSTHHDVANLVNLEIVQNTKTWISWERNKTFLKNKKKILTCAADDTVRQVIVL